MKKEFKSKSLPGLSREELNKLSYAQIARSEFMKIEHAENPERKKISQKGGKLGIQSALKWREENPEEAYEMLSNNGKKAAMQCMEEGKGIFALSDEERKANAVLGGSANTDKQKEARAKQVREHFQVKGTEAAAIAATKKYHAKIKQMIDLLPSGWFTVKEFELIKNANNIKRLNSRGALNETEFFEFKKEKGKNYYKILKQK